MTKILTILAFIVVAGAVGSASLVRGADRDPPSSETSSLDTPGAQLDPSEQPASHDPSDSPQCDFTVTDDAASCDAGGWHLSDCCWVGVRRGLWVRNGLSKCCGACPFDPQLHAQ